MPQSPEPGRIFVILNPHAGNRRARAVFAAAQPGLTVPGVTLSVNETRYPGHAAEMVRELALEDVRQILLVGGDGLVHEALNGLMQRVDSASAIRTPIAILPAGTGNGLYASLRHEGGPPGGIQPLDILRVEQAGRCYYAFLSLTWAAISDIDIGSEWLRAVNPIRYPLATLFAILRRRSYPGRLSFLPCDAKSPAESDWQTIEDEFLLFWAMNIPWAAAHAYIAPGAKLADGAMRLLAVRRGVGIRQYQRIFAAMVDGGHVNLPGVEYYQVRAFRLEPLGRQGIFAVDGERVPYSTIRMEVLPGLARVVSP
jgi:sphingosine kinase